MQAFQPVGPPVAGTGISVTRYTVSLTKPIKQMVMFENDSGSVPFGKFFALSGQAGVLGEGWDALETAVSVYMAMAGTFKNLYVNQQAVAAACTVTMRKNAADTLLSVNLPL